MKYATTMLQEADRQMFIFNENLKWTKETYLQQKNKESIQIPISVNKQLSWNSLRLSCFSPIIFINQYLHAYSTICNKIGLLINRKEKLNLEKNGYQPSFSAVCAIKKTGLASDICNLFTNDKFNLARDKLEHRENTEATRYISTLIDIGGYSIENEGKLTCLLKHLGGRTKEIYAFQNELWNRLLNVFDYADPVKKG